VPVEDPDVETSSEGYARRFAGPLGAFFLEVQARATVELLQLWPRSRILEVGGGHGQVTGPLLDAGHEVTVFGSPGALGEGIRKWTETGKVTFRAGDLLHAPWPDRAFDVVISYRLLAHVEGWPALLGELCRLARYAVLVDYPTARSANAAASAFFSLKKGVEGNTRPFTVFRDAEVEEALAASGFRVTGRRAEFFFPMAVHRALGSAPLARALEGAAAGLGLTRRLGSPVILRGERRG
jgi:SAM-dependent methyltransferase